MHIYTHTFIHIAYYSFLTIISLMMMTIIVYYEEETMEKNLHMQKYLKKNRINHSTMCACVRVCSFHKLALF